MFNPLLMSFGIHPEVSSATAMYMIIFSTGASTLTFILNELLILQYGIWVGIFCVVGSVIGMYSMDILMLKVKR